MSDCSESTERGIKLLVNPFRIHQKQSKPCMKCLLLCRCKLRAETISLLGNVSGFNQNFSEYKSHLIIEYFQCMNISSNMNIRYLNERVTIRTYIILLITNIYFTYMTCIVCNARGWNHIASLLYRKASRAIHLTKCRYARVHRKN